MIFSKCNIPILNHKQSFSCIISSDRKMYTVSDASWHNGVSLKDTKAPNQNNFFFLSLSILLPPLCDYLLHLIVDWLPWKPEVVCLLRVSLDTIKTREGRREREKAERHGERVRKSDAVQWGIKNSFSPCCHTLSASQLFPALSRWCFRHIQIFWVMVSSAWILSGLLKSWIRFLPAVWCNWICSWSFGSNFVMALLCRCGPWVARKNHKMPKWM